MTSQIGETGCNTGQCQIQAERDATWANNTSDGENKVSDLALDYCFIDNKFLSSELVI